MGHEAWPMLLKTLGTIAATDLAQCKTHGTRRGGATAMIQRGVDYPTVSKCLGHKRLRTTENYTEADAARIDEVADWMDWPEIGPNNRIVSGTADMAAQAEENADLKHQIRVLTALLEKTLCD
jgi:hypothetical protein